MDTISPQIATSPRPLRLGFLLWVAGMLGVVAFVWLVVPDLIVDRLPPGEQLPMPQWALVALTAIQTGILLALMVWLGVALAPKVGLHSPIAEAATAGRTAGPALRPFLRTGIPGTVLGWLLFLLSRALQPPALPAVDLPLVVRVLYGGITEEVLLRWGFLTLVVWLGWRFIQHRDGSPRRFVVWMGIILSAVVFGIGHLPMAALVTGGLTPDVVVFVVGFNTAFGILFGYLYWKGGLEAAMLAHAGAHILNYLT